MPTKLAERPTARRLPSSGRAIASRHVRPTKTRLLVPYLRQSRSHEASISIDEQRRDIRRWAKDNGAELAPEVIERNISGSRSWRERELGQIIAACERGESAGIIVADQDRLSREHGLATAEVWEALERSGSRLVDVNGSLDTATGDHEMLFSIKAALAREQWKRHKQNWKRAIRNAAERGVSAGRPPFGYCRGCDGRFELDPLTAPIVHELFRRRAAGESWRSLCAWLDGLIPAPTGGTWTIQSAASIIRRRTYRGEIKAHGVVYTDAHPAIVTEAEWQAAQGQKQRHSRNGSGGALLAGLLVCSTCGGTMIAEAGGSRGQHRYRCRVRRSDGVCPKPVQISRKVIDAHVSESFLARLSEPVVVEYEAGVERAAALARLEAAEAELAAFIQHTPAALPGYAEGLAVRERELEAAQQALQSLAAAPDFAPDELVAMWPALTTPERRSILAAAIEQPIVIRPAKGATVAVTERAVITWRSGVSRPARSQA